MKNPVVLLLAALASVFSVNSFAIDCSNLPAWNSSSVYTVNTQVQHLSKAYKANWWTQGQNPANHSGQWQEWALLGNCEEGGTNTPPVARINFETSTVYAGPAGAFFDASASSDADGDTLTYYWDFGPGNSAASDVSLRKYFYNTGTFTITLTVSDGRGGVGTDTAIVTVLPDYNPWSSSSSGMPPPSSRSSSSINPSSSSVVSSSSSVAGGNCSSPRYSAGTSYSANQLVQNAGSEYRCVIAGWCSSSGAWAYAPGTGMHWDQAWVLVRSCGAVVSSSSSSLTPSSRSSSSVVSSSSSSISGGVRAPGDSSPLPRHALVGYWHNFNNGSGLIRLADVDDIWDVIVIAFVDDAGNGNVAFNLDPALNKAQFIADVAAKRAQGKIVVLSYGGEKGGVTLNNATHLANFVDSTTAIINEYGFDGVDIDLESGAGVLHGAPLIQNMISAIKQLDSRFPNLYLSMAPEHPYVQGGHVAYSGIWGAYLPMIDQLRDELDLLHVQLYNNGGLATPYNIQPFQAGTVDMMVASALMLIEGFPLAYGSAGNFAGLRADQVALGLPSGPRAAGSGQATTANINRAMDCLTRLTSCGTVIPSRAYPEFRGVMTWSINWDVNDGRIFSIPVGTYLDTLP